MRNSRSGHKKNVDKEAKICQQEINPIAINADKWQNKLVPRIKYGAGSACLKQRDEIKRDDKSKTEGGF